MISVKSIASAIGALTVIIGAGFTVDQRFAKEDVVQRNYGEFRGYVVEQKLDRAQDDLWKVEDRIEKKGLTPELKERKRELQQRKEKLQGELKGLEKKLGEGK